MDQTGFRLRYDGGDASEHQVELRSLGHSLIGAEKIASDMFLVAIEGRLPKRRERRRLVALRAKAPAAHCYDQIILFAPVAGLLPFAYEVAVSYGADYVANAISFVLSKLGGRPREADVRFAKLMELTMQMQADMSHQADAARAHSLAHGDQLLQMAEILRPAARQLVAPLGPTVNALSVLTGRGESTADIDVPMADAIRAREPLEVGDMQTFFVHVDNVWISRRSMKVILKEGDGALVDAVIRDPAFDANPDENVYTDALGGDLVIDAKPTFRPATGELVKLHVMNARVYRRAA